MEVRNRDPEATAEAIASSLPRVSTLALGDLTLRAPDPSALRSDPSALRSDPRIFWPVFVNPTRACYRLFKSVALPVAPNPAYALEMLARSWRRVPKRLPEGSLPTATGGTIEIERSRYERYFIAPLDVLSGVAAIGLEERELMLRVLSRGVLPCFACPGESVVDRMVSSTLALSFAACGLRLFDSALGVSESPRSSVVVVVTVAGLLYFAAWYVLVYASALHSGPAALRADLSRRGTDADRLLCGALKLVGSGSVTGPGEGDELSCGYSVCDYRDRDIVRALLITFEGLLDTRTVLRVAQLYVPELTAQLPYLRALGKVPDNVKSAIEARDLWLETLRGGSSTASRNKDDEPPFVYVGDVAHEQHSSVRGALFKRDARPVAAPPPSHDDHGFDPWYDCLLIADSEAGHDPHELMALDPGTAGEAGDRDGTTPDLAATEYITQKLEAMTVQLVDDFPDDIYSDSTYNTDDQLLVTREQSSSSQQPVTEHRAHSGAEGGDSSRRVCAGLYVVETDALGFTEETPKVFLTQARDEKHLGFSPEKGSSIEALELKRPCMANIAHTVYTKIPGTENSTSVVRPHHRCRTLVEALWALLVGTRKESLEPYTVEALTVMIHLAVKSFELTRDAKLGPCNDVKALHTSIYDSEEKFIPVAAIAGGLFGINIQIYATGHIYRIINIHHGNRWPVGFLEYKDAGWSLRNLPVGYSIRRPVASEQNGDDCYHRGTYRSYARLNGLRVIQVDSDGYCGFHAISTLLAGAREMCNSERRKELAGKTAAFVFTHRQRLDIEQYLMYKTVNAQGLETLLTTKGRWLDVQDLKYILEAHGKTLGLITENSFPIYQPTCAYVLLKDNHYEPLLPRRMDQLVC